MSDKLKTKNQSLYRYFEHLQFEYLIAEFRKKIYPKKKDKEYWTKVMGYKKKKVEDIALRNQIPSILTDETLRTEYLSKIVKSKGFPNFHYEISDLDQSELIQKDKTYYYMINSEVKVSINDEIKIGEITNVNFEKDLIFIKLKNTTTPQPFMSKVVTRIM